MKKGMIWMLAAVVVLFGGVFGSHYLKQEAIARYIAGMAAKAVPVTAEVVKLADWMPTINAIGFIEPTQGAQLSSAAAGVVEAIRFESGQDVNAGDVLVLLDSARERADLRAAQGRLVSIQSDLERMQRLAGTGAVSRNDLDRAQAEYLSLKAQIEGLQASIERREIRAPFDGKTGIVQVNVGQYLQPGAVVVRLEAVNLMRIRFIVAERDYARIKVGMPIELDVDAYPGQTFEGGIIAIEPAVEYKSGVVQLQAGIPNSDGRLRVGMYAKVRIKLQPLINQIVVPQSAVRTTLYGESAYVLDPSPDGDPALGLARQVAIEVSERRGSLARVDAGLKAGDRLVLSGQLSLSNGTPVKIVEDDTLAVPAALPRR